MATISAARRAQAQDSTRCESSGPIDHLAQVMVDFGQSDYPWCVEFADELRELAQRRLPSANDSRGYLGAGALGGRLCSGFAARPDLGWLSRYGGLLAWWLPRACTTTGTQLYVTPVTTPGVRWPLGVMVG